MDSHEYVEIQEIIMAYDNQIRRYIDLLSSKDMVMEIDESLKIMKELPSLYKNLSEMRKSLTKTEQREEKPVDPMTSALEKKLKEKKRM